MNLDAAIRAVVRDELAKLLAEPAPVRAQVDDVARARARRALVRHGVELPKEKP